MCRRRFAVSSFWLIALLPIPALAAAPKVVETVPENGAIDVDPGLSEIRVTFDQAMSHGGHSVVGGGESFPRVTARPRWESARVISIPVRLEPKHDYWLSINSGTYQNFRSRAGEPAVPYPISFRTGAKRETGDAESADGQAKTSPSDNERALARLEEALAQHYSYRDRSGIDWAKVLQENRDALMAAGSAHDFAKRAATLLARAQDKHVFLLVDGQMVPSYVRPATPNANFQALPKLVPNFRQLSRVVAQGKWEDGIGYLLIGTWDRRRARAVLPLFEVLWEMHDAPGLVLDLRANGGGDEFLARGVAGCFIDEPVLYAKQLLEDPDQPGQFTKMQDRVLEPNKRRPRYRGKIAVLMGPVNMSSSEAFLMMMRQVPQARLIGARSQGSSGNPQPYDLGNGVVAYLPSWQSLMADGKPLEGVGIEPDIVVEATRSDFADGDPVLDAALKYLRGE